MPLKPLEDGRIFVLTFKRGLLSRVAHDLRLRLERFELDTDGEQVEGRFHPDSLVVEGAMKDGRLDPDCLSESDRNEIVRNIRGEILDTSRYPRAELVARAEAVSGGYRVKGELELRGERRPIELDVRKHGERLTGSIELVPSRWGIEPFKALLGAIKLQDRVVVSFDFRAPG